MTSDENTNNQPNYNLSLHNTDDIVQDCSNSIANALELLQSCTDIYANKFWTHLALLINSVEAVLFHLLPMW